MITAGETFVATAPVRIADCGGWTDTWFAGYGAVCSLAAAPGVEVTATLQPGSGSARLALVDYGEVIEVHPTRRGDSGRVADQPHKLLRAAVARMLNSDTDAEVTISSAVPPGSSLGTSASVLVALLAALGGDEDPDCEELARVAHLIETEDLGGESGVQDQRAAAHGGALLLTITRYPEVEVERLCLRDETWSALEQRLITVSIGSPHSSSAVHTRVVEGLQADASLAVHLDPLRASAAHAAAALVRGDLVAYGAALTEATEGQRALDTALIDPGHDKAIDIARRHGALGWKVNGAGGDGGSVTILSSSQGAGLRRALAASFEVLPCRATRRGLTVVHAGG